MIIYRVDRIEDSFVDHLEKAVIEVFQIFPFLPKKYRKSYYRALAKLLLALSSKGSAYRTLLKRIRMLSS